MNHLNYPLNISSTRAYTEVEHESAGKGGPASSRRTSALEFRAMATTQDTDESVSDESTDIQTYDYGPGGDYVDQRFLAEGRYDY